MLLRSRDAAASALVLCGVTMLLAVATQRRGSFVETTMFFRGETPMGLQAAPRPQRGGFQQQRGGFQQLGGFPVPPNYYQEPTVWNGDHVTSGGNKEWAEEDAALHAYNMQRSRNDIIVEQTDRQRSQWDLMNEANYWDTEDYYYKAKPTQLRQKMPLTMPSRLRTADAQQQMLMYGHVDLPTEYFSWKKESGSSQCEDGCAFQDKVFTVDGFDKLCLTHCGEVENAILKDASKGQRKGIALANVRGTMLSETERKRQRLVQAHEPWNLDASPVEKKKYYELRRQRFERGESSRG